MGTLGGQGSLGHKTADSQPKLDQWTKVKVTPGPLQIGG